MGQVDTGDAGRGEWGRHIEFILTLVGFAVGLGNVWRFPYLCYKNGGGAFLIPYLIFLVFIGIPIFGLEVAFGQFGGKGPITIWTMNPAFKGLGFASVAVSAIICIYYDVIIAWGLYYFFASMTSSVPWTKCDDCACLLYNINNVSNVDMANISGQYNCTSFDGPALSSSEIYYNRDVLAKTDSVYDSGTIRWQLMLCNLLAWIVVFIVLSKGIKSLGKVVYFSSTFPYLLLITLLVRCAMLDGAIDGIKFYLTPRWEELKKAEVWSDAAVQIFFSLSACQGGLVAMASYNKFSNNVLRDAILVPVINCLTSFLAGFVVFSTLGFMAHVKNEPVANVTKGGAGLAFVAYPEALAQMPITPLWSILFFFMLCLLGFSSQFSIVETVLTSFIDEFKVLNTKVKKTLFRVIVCIVGFALGLPIVLQNGAYLLDLVDGYILGFPTLFVGLFELITIIWIYGYGNFAKDVELMVGRKPYLYLKACWVVISPALLIAVIVFKAYQYEPGEDEVPFTTALGWMIVACPIIMIPGWFLFYTCPRGIWARLRELNSPKEEWMKIKQRGLGKEEKQIDGNISTVNGTMTVTVEAAYIYENNGYNEIGDVDSKPETSIPDKPGEKTPDGVMTHPDPSGETINQENEKIEMVNDLIEAIESHKIKLEDPNPPEPSTAAADSELMTRF